MADVKLLGTILLLIYVFGVTESKYGPLSSSSNLLVFYSNGDHNIIVKDLGTGKTLKTFTTVVKNPGSIVVDYEKDILFYTHGQRVYQICLVDTYGTRKVSGNGNLFTNPLSDHIESVFYYLPTMQNAKGLLYDKADGMLYLIAPYYNKIGDYFYRIDSKNGEVTSSGRIHFTASRYILHGRTLYASSDHENDNGACVHLSTITIDDLNKEKSWKWLENRHCWSVDSLFTVDPLTNRIFYVQDGHAIKVIDDNIKKGTLALMKDRIVIANSEVANDIEAISTHGRIVVWSSRQLKKIFVGFIDTKTSFMSKQNVQVLESGYDEYRNIILLKNDIDNNTDMIKRLFG